MRRDREDRVAAATAQFSQIIEILELRNFLSADVENDYIGVLQTNFRRRNEQNPHAGGVREDFCAIKDSVVQRDGENAKAEESRPFEQLMRGIIDNVFGIVERVQVQIEFDPIALIF